MENSIKDSKEKLRKSRFLRNKRSFIFITILCMGIGFAFLSSNLTINGNTTVSKNKWNIYFTNVQVTEGSVEATVVPTTSGTNTTSIDYAVVLDKPGDFYEFTVDAVNDGTIDAKIKNISMTNLDSDVSRYLLHTATYLDDTPLSENDILQKKSTVTYKVRVEFRQDISASDLLDEDNNLNLTFGVNYVQETSKQRITAFTKLVKNNALSDINLDFTQSSSVNNGEGLYLMESTKNKTYPIYYYRGAVENNNAKFAGYCWKIVRTTETGGTKLVYNGLPGEVYSTVEKLSDDSYEIVTNEGTYPYTYNSETKNWTSVANSSVNNMEITFSVKSSGDYFLNYELSENMYAELYKDGEQIGWLSDSSETIKVFGLTPSNVLKISYSDYSDSGEISDSFSFNMEKGIDTVIGCDNTGDDTQIEKAPFSSEFKSLAYVGYMYGTAYEYKSNKKVSSDYSYGTGFEFVDTDPNVSGDGTYTLKNAVTDTNQVNTHHYTCFNLEGTCSELYYVYFKNGGSDAYYISLKDGKGIEDAFDEMSQNIHDSSAKTKIDTWFKDTFRKYFTTRLKDYNDYLEDTVWCNDRSMNTIEVELNAWEGVTSVENGWKPNGGDITEHLWYGAYGRVRAGVPSLACPNKNDSFTVEESENGNGALTYPIGLLTADEINLAGGQSNTSSMDPKKDFYLYNGNRMYTMTPYYFYGGFGYGAGEFYLDEEGFLTGYKVTSYEGLRPAISVKSTVKIARGGDGTKAFPYEFVVE